MEDDDATLCKFAALEATSANQRRFAVNHQQRTGCSFEDLDTEARLTAVLQSADLDLGQAMSLRYAVSWEIERKKRRVRVIVSITATVLLMLLAIYANTR